MKLKNKMHACLMAAVASATVIIGTWGSMQYVFAQEGSYLDSLNAGAARSTAADTTVKSAKASISANTQGGQSSVSSETVNSTIDTVTGEKIEIKISPETPEEQETVDTEQKIAGISYDRLVMANVEEAVNVRSEASENAQLIGKLYKECAGEILEKGSGWTKIKTGELTGWVKNEYLLFGSEAQKLAESVVVRTAISKTESLRVRKEPNESAGVYGLLALGDEIEAMEELGDWVSVQYSDGTLGYVASRFVTISDELGKGETIEVIEAREEACGS